MSDNIGFVWYENKNKEVYTAAFSFNGKRIVFSISTKGMTKEEAIRAMARRSFELCGYYEDEIEEKLKDLESMI